MVIDCITNTFRQIFKGMRKRKRKKMDNYGAINDSLSSMVSEEDKKDTNKKNKKGNDNELERLNRITNMEKGKVKSKNVSESTKYDDSEMDEDEINSEKEYYSRNRIEKKVLRPKSKNKVEDKKSVESEVKNASSSSEKGTFKSQTASNSTKYDDSETYEDEVYNKKKRDSRKKIVKKVIKPKDKNFVKSKKRAEGDSEFNNASLSSENDAFDYDNESDSQSLFSEEIKSENSMSENISTEEFVDSEISLDESKSDDKSVDTRKSQNQNENEKVTSKNAKLQELNKIKLSNSDRKARIYANYKKDEAKVKNLVDQKIQLKMLDRQEKSLRKKSPSKMTDGLHNRKNKEKNERSKQIQKDSISYKSKSAKEEENLSPKNSLKGESLVLNKQKRKKRHGNNEKTKMNENKSASDITFDDYLTLYNSYIKSNETLNKINDTGYENIFDNYDEKNQDDFCNINQKIYEKLNEYLTKNPTPE